MPQSQDSGFRSSRSCLVTSASGTSTDALLFVTGIGVFLRYKSADIIGIETIRSEIPIDGIPNVPDVARIS